MGKNDGIIAHVRPQNIALFLAGQFAKRGEICRCVVGSRAVGLVVVRGWRAKGRKWTREKQALKMSNLRLWVGVCHLR